MTAGGRYSKFLPVRLAARYEEARQDPQLLSLADDLAVLETRLCELLQGLDAKQTARQWERALVVWKGGKAAEEDRRAELWQELDSILTDGANQAEQWEEIASVMEQRRRLSETESKRLAQMQQYVTAQQANLLVAALIRVVNEHVPDAGTRGRLAVELARLLERPAPAGVDTA